MTAWKATANPWQPVQSCGLAVAWLAESIVSAETALTLMWRLYSPWPSAVGDAVTTLSGPPAAAGAARQTVKVMIRAIRRRMASGLPGPLCEQTKPSARREGRVLEHLAQAALEIVGGDADVGERARCAALGVAQQREQQVLDAEVLVPEALRFAQGLLECGARRRGDRDAAAGGCAGRRRGQAEARDRIADRLELDADRGEALHRRAVGVSHQTEQEVAWIDLGVVERAGRGAAGADRPAGLSGHGDVVAARREASRGRRRIVETLG